MPIWWSIQASLGSPHLQAALQRLDEERLAKALAPALHLIEGVYCLQVTDLWQTQVHEKSLIERLRDWHLFHGTASGPTSHFFGMCSSWIYAALQVDARELISKGAHTGEELPTSIVLALFEVLSYSALLNDAGQCCLCALDFT